ncbi:hypothetical protein [Actinomadura parmotrematis]|uniref:DUF385 domain-containing protein n=1 Tax=Actinomadura parmotrematis TaxID=2864039 RepID=A0ABS7FZJ1_9ACTN|nr:hypothetical protein [Actinomadura parmotrematis]MBW8485853.1 hypothetical protein [Actinomadura parmotrematis]
MAEGTPAVVRRHPPNAVMKIVNPLMRRSLRRGRGKPAQGLMLLRFTGRRSGRAFELPVARQPLPEGLYVFTSSPWRANLRGGADVEAVLDGRAVPMRAELIEDPAEVADLYRRRFAEVGVKGAGRLGVKLNVDREPTPEELADAARTSGLSAVRLTERPA